MSMATFAARRLQPMISNVAHIIAIEWLAAAQGIEFLRPLRSSPALEQVHALLKKHGELSRPQVAELMGTSYTCAHRWLSMLADQGRVRRCGHPRMPIWTPR